MLVSTFERLCDVTLTKSIIPSFKPPKVEFVISKFLGCSECCSSVFSLVWIYSPGYAWIVLKHTVQQVWEPCSLRYQKNIDGVQSHICVVVNFRLASIFPTITELIGELKMCFKYQTSVAAPGSLNHYMK